MKTRRAKVVYSYAPQNDDELKLEVDDMIEVLDEIEEGWWKGVVKGQTGVFPSNFVVEVTSDSPQINKRDMSDKSDNDSLDGSKSSLDNNLNDGVEKKPKPIAKVGFGDIFAGGIKPKLSPIGDSTKNIPKKPPPPTPANDNEAAPKLPPKPVREQAKVLFSYEAQNEDELTIKEGDIINIVSKDIEDVGWWKGELNGRIALFPDNFVELIKPNEDQNSKVAKKPERPTEKPPPIASSNSATNSPKLTNLSKSDSIKSSHKSEELPKTSVVSNNISVSSSGVSSAPVIPGKKPKGLSSSLFQSKPKQEAPQPSAPSAPSSVRPDVVPQENGSKADKEVDSSSRTNNSSENHFTSMDSTGNKLTHLTASRVKGPPSRRPPSTIFIPKESGTETKENGDVSVSAVNNNKVDTNCNHSSEHKPSQAQTPPEPKPTPSAPTAEKLPPWMVELRKAQEKRKENPEESPKPSVHSPTKPSANRFSGDFSNKPLQQSSVNDDNESNNSSIHVFKPLKSTKPNITTTSVTAQPVSETPPTTVSSVTTATNATNKTTNIVISSATTTTTTTPPPKVEESVAAVTAVTAVNAVTADKNLKSSEVTELEKEIRALRESTVSRKDFDALVKQVTELKEVVESQKLSYSKIIKDLINDVAEERKKLATLQIEIDRLRKLTTTV